MKILIVGYGRMGQEIEKVLTERGHEVSGRVDPHAPGADAPVLSTALLHEADAAIEFSLPRAAVPNALLYAETGCPAVVGTTGWDGDRDHVRDEILNKRGAYLYGSNFSIGAHFLFLLAERAARLTAALPEYDTMITEYHHKMKKDSPSGTALSLAQKVLDNQERKTEIVASLPPDRAIRPRELHVASVRGGAIPGIHSLLFDSPADSVEIRHTARNRSGFALGAVRAAEWLAGKKGFFRVEQFIEDIFNEKRG